MRNLNVRLLLEEISLVILLLVAPEAQLRGRVFLFILDTPGRGLGGAELSAVLVPSPETEQGNFNKSGQADPE